MFGFVFILTFEVISPCSGRTYPSLCHQVLTKHSFPYTVLTWNPKWWKSALHHSAAPCLAIGSPHAMCSGNRDQFVWSLHIHSSVYTAASSPILQFYIYEHCSKQAKGLLLLSAEWKHVSDRKQRKLFQDYSSGSKLNRIARWKCSKSLKQHDTFLTCFLKHNSLTA